MSGGVGFLTSDDERGITCCFLLTPALPLTGERKRKDEMRLPVLVLGDVSVTYRAAVPLMQLHRE